MPCVTFQEQDGSVHPQTVAPKHSWVAMECPEGSGLPQCTRQGRPWCRRPSGAQFHMQGDDVATATTGGSSQGGWKRQRAESGCVCFGVSGNLQQGALEPSLSLLCQHSKPTEPRPPPQGQTHQTFLRQGHMVGVRQGRVRTLQLRALRGAEIQTVMSVRTVAKAPCQLVFRSVVQSLCPALVVLCF